MRKFWLIVYYGFAKHLPKSNRGLLGKFGGWLRYRCAWHLFAECNGFVNLEHGAYIGNGKKSMCWVNVESVRILRVIVEL